MPENSAADVGDTLSAPLGDMIAAIGRGVAEAQEALDAQTISRVKAMFKGDDRMLEELRLMGYQPTWYRIPEVEAEVTVAMSISASSESQGGGGAAGGAALETGQDAPVGGPGKIKMYGAPVDANYANKYGFNLSASSKVKFKIVPVPPTPEAEKSKVVPGLGNKTFEEIQALLDELEIPFRLKDPNLKPAQTAVIRSWMPRMGTVLPPGQAIVLNF